MESRQARWQREHYRRKTALLNRLKTLVGCVDCGYRAHHAALDFDHRDPAEKDPRLKKRPFSLKKLSMTDLRAELQKCEVRCSNCHRVRHSQ